MKSIQSPLASFFPSRIISSQRCHSININSKALERLFAACRRAYLSIIAHVPMGMRAQMLVNAPWLAMTARLLLPLPI